VLTDGRLFFSPRGEELKCFHVRDGKGIVDLLRAGIQIAVISGRNSKAVERRMSELGITWVRQGVHDKLAVLHELLDILNLGPQAVASMGDDTPDLPIFGVARLAIAVADAHRSVKSQAHFITQANGGEGAVREVCDLILESQRRT
jgi:3-deoxy-D-manno-octulosonate 8-phosphate phosphatase (KDO 8-P phosphatase)